MNDVPSGAGLSPLSMAIGFPLASRFQRANRGHLPTGLGESIAPDGGAVTERSEGKGA